MLIRIFVFVFFLFTFSFFLPKSFAASDIPSVKQEFATSYDVIYDVDLDGVTTVTEKINLRNLTSQSYANQFKLIIGATDIFDIKASDGGGIMQVSSEQKDASTIITVKFNQQVAGINKILSWTLQFKSKDFAERKGKIWEKKKHKNNTTTKIKKYK